MILLRLDPESLAQSWFALWPLAETVAATIILACADDASLEPWAQSHRSLPAGDLFAAGFISLA